MSIRTFTIAEARTLVLRARRVADQLIPVRADLADGLARHRAGEEVPLAELKALEARFAELLEWFPAHGIEVKSTAPLLLDLPHRAGDRALLLCWLEGEPELAWYHDPALGFMGRRPLRELAR